MERNRKGLSIFVFASTLLIQGCRGSPLSITQFDRNIGISGDPFEHPLSSTHPLSLDTKILDNPAKFSHSIDTGQVEDLNLKPSELELPEVESIDRIARSPILLFLVPEALPEFRLDDDEDDPEFEPIPEPETLAVRDNFGCQNEYRAGNCEDTFYTRGKPILEGKMKVEENPIVGLTSTSKPSVQPIEEKRKLEIPASIKPVDIKEEESTSDKPKVEDGVSTSEATTGGKKEKDFSVPAANSPMTFLPVETTISSAVTEITTEMVQPNVEKQEEKPLKVMKIITVQPSIETTTQSPMVSHVDPEPETEEKPTEMVSSKMEVIPTEDTNVATEEPKNILPEVMNREPEIVETTPETTKMVITIPENPLAVENKEFSKEAANIEPEKSTVIENSLTMEPKSNSERMQLEKEPDEKVDTKPLELGILDTMSMTPREVTSGQMRQEVVPTSEAQLETTLIAPEETTKPEILLVEPHKPKIEAAGSEMKEGENETPIPPTNPPSRVIETTVPPPSNEPKLISTEAPQNVSTNLTIIEQEESLNEITEQPPKQANLITTPVPIVQVQPKVSTESIPNQHNIKLKEEDETVIVNPPIKPSPKPPNNIVKNPEVSKPKDGKSKTRGKPMDSEVVPTDCVTVEVSNPKVPIKRVVTTDWSSFLQSILPKASLDIENLFLAAAMLF